MKNQDPLHIAAKFNSIEIGKLLISKGNSINTRDIKFYNRKIIFEAIYFSKKNQN